MELPQAIDGREGFLNLTFTLFFPNENIGSLTVFEAFHQFRADDEQAYPGTLRLWYASNPVRLGCGDLMCYSCLTKNAPVIKRLFLYFRLFTLSAQSEPQFWARTLLVYFLCWIGYARLEFVDTILASLDCKSNADKNRVFCLPSRGMFVLRSLDQFSATQ